MFINLINWIFPLSVLLSNTFAENLSDFCEKTLENGKYVEKCEHRQYHFSRKRYILYDVNPPEGFNLRRDVYIRVATFVKQLTEENKEYQWNLVLPPWGHLYHWQSKDIGSQNQIPWSTFFDLQSLKKYTSIIEMHEFIKEYSIENGNTVIDCVYFLKNDEEMFKTGNFEDKNVIINCSNTGFPYKNNTNGYINGYFWGYSNITAHKVECIIFHGTTIGITKNLLPNLYRTVMFDHMEIPLHYAYGSLEYWKARRSMRYNLELYEIANEFRLIYLSSNDLDDNTEKPVDWRLEKKKRNAIGGPYLSVHLRRRDFVVGHAASTPTLEDAALQIKKTLKLLNLDTVFIATDAQEEEYSLLKDKLINYGVFRFVPTISIKKKFKDGGIAIIDQIICSHARYFIGTHESTFTFRIQEEREIIGFPTNTTFNTLCKKDKKCLSGGRWEIVWN